jgi:hypothetical protein
MGGGGRSAPRGARARHDTRARLLSPFYDRGLTIRVFVYTCFRVLTTYPSRHSMALKDLIASKAALAEDAIEEIIGEFARYDPDHRVIIFTPEAHRLSNKARVLIYLVALQGWPFILDDAVPVDAKPGEIEEHTGIPGGTLRPTLKELKDRSVIIERGGRYSIRAVALQAIKAELAGSASNSGSKKSPRKSRSAPVEDNALEEGTTATLDEKRARRSKTGNLQEQFDLLVDGNFFDKPKSLADVQKQFHKKALIVPQTSLPPYLLRAVRSERLDRDKADVNGRHVWVYTRKRKP